LTKLGDPRALALYSQSDINIRIPDAELAVLRMPRKGEPEQKLPGPGPDERVPFRARCSDPAGINAGSVSGTVVTTGRTTLTDARRFIDDLERKLAPLDRNILLAEWRLVTGRSMRGSAAHQTRRHQLLSSPGTLGRIRHLREVSPPGPLQRRLELAERAVLESEIEQTAEIVQRRARLQQAIAGYRPRWHGRRTGRAIVRAVLRTSEDRRERERAFYSEEPLYRPIEADLVSLVAARNERANELGYRSFPEYRLSMEGFTVPGLEALMEDALRFVPREMRRRRDQFEDRTHERGWYPWDLRFAEEQERRLPDTAFPGGTMFPAIVAGIRRWGFPPSAFHFRVDRHDLAVGGLCLAPDPPKDVRIVVQPAGGWSQYRVLFHEVGHAMSSRSIRQPTSHLLRWHEGIPGFAGLAEGEGRFFEQIASSERWLRERTGLPSEVREAAIRNEQRAPLQTLAWLAGWVQQELTLYLHPDRDPVEPGVRFARRLFGYDRYRGLSFANSFVVEAPLYSPSYVYAELLRPALTASLLEEVGGELWPNAHVGPWLVRHWLRDGSSFDWWTRLRELTGRPFGAEPFNAEMRRIAE
jgi:hypothetical protein